MQYIAKHTTRNITLAADTKQELDALIHETRVSGSWFIQEEYNVLEEISNFLRRINTPNARIALKILQVILLGLIAIALLI